MKGLRRLLGGRYVVAMVATLAAVLVRWSLNPLLGHQLPFITLYCALAVAVWFGGWRPALLAMAAGYIATDLIFIETEANSPLSLKNPGGIAGLLVYLVSSIIVIAFGNGMRAGQRRAEASVEAALAQQKRLERESAERKRAEEALAESNRRKDEFLALLAHELRNPLAPMRNALHVLRSAKGKPELLERARDIMGRQIDHMVRIVDDLLDVSRITSGKIELRRETIELAAAVENAVEICRPIMEAAGQELTVALPPEPIHLNADLTRLTQVFCNLLNNASKYTPKGGQIWLTGTNHAGEATISVKDTGIGIPPDMLPSIFDMFTQVDRRLERSQGGLGIGLALVRRLVEMHGGRVEARSSGVGQGSEFTLHLPVIHDGSRLPEAGTPKAHSRELVPPRRVLVVDDNKDAAESLAMLLRLDGHEVRLAHDGLEAVEKALEGRPELVFLDIGLPELNGYAVARRIRAEPWGERIVLIALTGWGQEEHKRRAMEAGFQHHLTKPVNPAVLSSLLAHDAPRTDERSTRGPLS